MASAAKSVSPTAGWPPKGRQKPPSAPIKPQMAAPRQPLRPRNVDDAAVKPRGVASTPQKLRDADDDKTDEIGSPETDQAPPQKTDQDAPRRDEKWTRLTFAGTRPPTRPRREHGRQHRHGPRNANTKLTGRGGGADGAAAGVDGRRRRCGGLRAGAAAGALRRRRCAQSRSMAARASGAPTPARAPPTTACAPSASLPQIADLVDTDSRCARRATVRARTPPPAPPKASAADDELRDAAQRCDALIGGLEPNGSASAARRTSSGPTRRCEMDDGGASTMGPRAVPAARPLL